MPTTGIYKREGKRGTTYTAIVDLPRGADGKRRQKRKSFKRRKDAVDWRNKTIHDLRQGTYVEPSMLPLGEYLDHWLVTKQVADNTMLRYASAIENHIRPALKDVPLGRLQGRDIQAFYNASRQRLTRPEILHIVLKMVLDQAVAEGLLPRNPTAGLKGPRPLRSDDTDDHEPDLKAWTADQLRAFLTATQGHRDHAAFWVAAHTGLRVGELVSLRWQDVDLDARVIRVTQNQTRDRSGKIRTGPTKSKAGRRTLGIDPETVMVLRGQRAIVQGYREALGAGWQEHDLVFPNVDGSIRRAGSLSDTFKYAVRRLGLPHIGFHGLRHSHFSLLAAQGRPLHYIQRRAGHASITVTANIYAHLLPGTEHDDADAFAAIMRGARETS